MLVRNAHLPFCVVILSSKQRSLRRPHDDRPNNSVRFRHFRTPTLATLTSSFDSRPDLSVWRPWAGSLLKTRVVGGMLVWLSVWSTVQTTLWSTYKLYDLHAIFLFQIISFKKYFMFPWVIIFYCFGGGPWATSQFAPPLLNPALFRFPAWGFLLTLYGTKLVATATSLEGSKRELQVIHLQS